MGNDVDHSGGDESLKEKLFLIAQRWKSEAAQKWICDRKLLHSQSSAPLKSRLPTFKPLWLEDPG